MGKIKEIKPFENKYHIEGKEFNCFETFMDHVTKVFKYHYEEHDGLCTFEEIMSGSGCAIRNGELVEISWAGKEKSKRIINTYYEEECDDEYSKSSFDEFVQCIQNAKHKLIFIEE